MLWCEEQLQSTSQGAMIISDTNNANHTKYLKNESFTSAIWREKK